MSRLIRFLAAAALLVLSSTQLQATHAYGGEITWKCFTTGPNAGKVRFYMRVYRDCGSGFNDPGPNVNLVSTVPGVSSIAMTQTNQNTLGGTDVSPTCYLIPSPINCGGVPAGQGGIQEKLYESNSFYNLTGVPPATGWIFSFTVINRPTILTNIPGSSNLVLRAVMYPYSINGTPQNMSTC